MLTTLPVNAFSALQLLVSSHGSGRARVYDLTAQLGCGRELVHRDDGNMPTVTVCEEVKGQAASHGGLIATMSDRLLKVCVAPPLRNAQQRRSPCGACCLCGAHWLRLTWVVACCVRPL